MRSASFFLIDKYSVPVFSFSVCVGSCEVCVCVCEFEGDQSHAVEVRDVSGLLITARAVLRGVMLVESDVIESVCVCV